jgi:hypothetical protein
MRGALRAPLIRLADFAAGDYFADLSMEHVAHVGQQWARERDFTFAAFDFRLSVNEIRVEAHF